MKINKAILIIMWAVIFSSCKEEEETLPPVEVTVSPNVAVNEWILAVMGEVYLWVENMRTPTSESAEPEVYFEALLFRPTDRFSVIYPDYQELINSLSGVNLEAGYEFILFRENSTSNNVVAEITYVKKNSPASSANLRRGDVITKINGTTMTVDNFRDVLKEIEGLHTLSYLRFIEESGGFVPQEEVTLSAIQLSENPNFLDSIYTINDEKIGYVVYHFFAPGAGNNSTAYDDEMDAIFEKFKSENIDHLVVDFRYNGGGFVSSAVNLGSLIGPGVNSTSVFSKTKYNKFLMDNVASLRNVQTPFRNKAQNLGNILEGNRVYILTSSRTASASELIINGLKPYMDVFIIGDKTTGKNVGSVAFEDDENPANNYGMLPIVSQSFNSLDESNYTNGFEPNIIVKETQERLRPFGDVNELLLRTAISQITGTPSGARFQQLNRQDVGSTLDSKIRNGVMVENPIWK